MGNDGLPRRVRRLGRDLRSRSASPSALRGDPASASKEVLRFGELSPYPKRMREENKIDGAHKIGETASRTRQAQRAAPQPCKNTFKRERGRHWHTGVMPAEGVQPMRVGCGNHWFAKPGSHSFCAAIWIKQSKVEVAVFNGVKTIYFGKKPRSD